MGSAGCVCPAGAMDAICSRGAVLADESETSTTSLAASSSGVARAGSQHWTTSQLVLLSFCMVGVGAAAMLGIAAISRRRAASGAASETADRTPFLHAQVGASALLDEMPTASNSTTVGEAAQSETASSRSESVASGFIPRSDNKP